MPPPNPSTPPPPLPAIVFHKNPEEDDVGLRATLEAATSPMTFMQVRGALRTTALVSFPMFVIAIHPNTMFRLGFPQMLIAAVISTSTHRNTLGEQIGVHSWTVRGITAMLVLSLIFDSMNLNSHEGVWWGLLAASIFGMALCTNGAIRRFLFLYTFVYMMEIRMYHAYFGVLPETNGAWLAADLYVGTLIGVAANIFPYPLSSRTLLDTILSKMYEGIGKLLVGMIAFASASPSDDITTATSASLFFSDRTPFEKIEGILTVMPPLLWFASWEPLQYPVRNPVRRLKLALMKRVLALCYAARSAGQTTAELRRRVHEQRAMHEERQRLMHEVAEESEQQKKLNGRNPSSNSNNSSSSTTESDDGEENRTAARLVGTSENDTDTHEKSEGKAQPDEGKTNESSANANAADEYLWALRTSTQRGAAQCGQTLLKAMAALGDGASNDPAKAVEMLCLEELETQSTQLRRSVRVLSLQMLQRHGELVAEHQQKNKRSGNGDGGNARGDARTNQQTNADNDKKEGIAHDPTETDIFKPDAQKKVTIAESHEPTGENDGSNDTPDNSGGDRSGDGDLTLETVAQILSFEDAAHEADIILGIHEMHFYLLICLIAGEVIAFGESMRTYRPSWCGCFGGDTSGSGDSDDVTNHGGSLCTRLWRDMIVEPWNGFWSELWCVLTLARPSDVRTLKDAVKITSAYLSATALNLKIWVVPGGGYYFGTTILLGLPVEEESLGIGVNRLAGNSLGCALGYLALHNTKNLSESIGLCLVFVFIQQACKHHPIFGQTFFYGSVITLAGMATSTITLELLTRVLASCYTIVAYMLCCMLIFPNNPIKILWGYRCKFARVMSETIDDVAVTLQLPLDYFANRVETSETEDTTETSADRPEGGDSESSSTESHNGELTRSNSGTDTTNQRIVFTPRADAVDMCSQLNIQVGLLRKLQAMCEKWTPFASKDVVLRGVGAFPAGPSATVLFAHTRLLASLEHMVFCTQLLLRPRWSAPPHPVVVRLLNGKVAQFMTKFADACRMFFQDFINSLQLSRTWSYPGMLRNISALQGLRPLLSVTMFECYALIGTLAARGTKAMTAGDYQQLRREQEGAANQHDDDDENGGGSGGVLLTHIEAGDDDEDNAAGDKVRKPQCGNGLTDGTERYPYGSHAADNDLGNNNNASFADRVLANRRTAQALQDQRSPSSHNPSFALNGGSLNNTRNNSYVYHAKYDHWEEGSPFFSDEHNRDRNCNNNAIYNNNNNSFNNMSVSLLHPPHKDKHTGAAGHANKEGSHVRFSYRAPLTPDSPGQPDNMIGVTATNAEEQVAREVRHALAHDDREETAAAAKRKHQHHHHQHHHHQQAAAPTHSQAPSPTEAAHNGDRAHHGAPEEEQQPHPQPPVRRPSRLVLHTSFAGQAGAAAAAERNPNASFAVVESSPRADGGDVEGQHSLVINRLPRYQGPLFSYQEDELDLPIDTDFSALLALLASCRTVMSEIEHMASAVNNISAYQKQLHETTLVLKLLDKASDAIAGWRRGVYARYHHHEQLSPSCPSQTGVSSSHNGKSADTQRPAAASNGNSSPLPGSRSPVQMQNDPWEKWRF